MAQETLDEAAKRLFSYEYGEETYVTDKKRDAFIEGYQISSDEIIQSFQPKTEWDVEFVDDKLKLKS